ncbi:AAA family ATPase [Rhizobium leguminosarum]|uniref:AAA family ATPase n=1 Tax=Rhizobium leguminosarum TaxID=384 RepID=UPI001C8FB599|nr:ATP-binding protein [Rhizobium leguminosarum]MBY2905736.1 AAA family ATPase [Rhizobium leguminosarum]
MRVNEVQFELNESRETVALGDSDYHGAANSFSVLHGKNGSGKSALLRIISDAALGLDNSRSKVFARAIKIEQTGKINRIFAISGTHNDRFPLNSGMELRTDANRFDLLHFYYYGPKQSGNYTSVSKASNTIAHSLLNEDEEAQIPNKQLTDLLGFMGFEPSISIAIRPGLRIRNNKDEADYFNRLQQHYVDLRREATGPSKVSISMEFAIGDALAIASGEGFKRLRTSKDPGKIVINFRRAPSATIFGSQIFSEVLRSPSPRPQSIADFISIGVFSAKIELSRSVSGEVVRLDDLSSGEWQLLYTLLNLSKNITSDSLVLIDEPENSLHPQWQSDYVRLVSRSISHVSGCHVIIATHSPLIAASVMPEDGNLVQLSRDNDVIGRFRTKLEDTAYGWRPGDVLEERFNLDSARPPELTAATDEALRLLKTSSETSPQLREVAERIRSFKRHLPTYDPLNAVLEAIIDLAFPTKDADGKAE